MNMFAILRYTLCLAALLGIIILPALLHSHHAAKPVDNGMNVATSDAGHFERLAHHSS